MITAHREPSLGEGEVPSEEPEEQPESGSPRSRLLARNLCASISDGAGYGVMVGMGETYIPAFALAVGFEDRTAGLLASIPMLAGGMMQMVSPRAVRLLGSHRRWIILCVVVQALSFLPFVAAALIGSIPAWVAFLVSSIYWGAGMGAGPAWNTWIGTLVPRSLRARYFARRTRISQFAVFAGFAAGGFSLQFGKQAGVALQTFAGLFAISAFCRMLSAWFLTMQSEHVPIRSEVSREPLLAQLRSLYKGREGRLLRYIIAVQAAVQISGPYFSPFMLKQLQMSYGMFALLIAVSFLAKILALPVCGRFAHRFGPTKLLWVGGVGIVPVAAMWLISENLWWLMTVQVVGGFVWAAYELAFFLMFFDSIPERDRTRLLTLYNFANAAALCVGSLIGGAILTTLGATHDVYCLLFALSSLARAMTLPLLRRVPGTTGTMPVPAPLGLRTDAVRPSGNTIMRPIVPSLAARPEPSLRTSDPGRRIDGPAPAVPQPASVPAVAVAETVA